MYNINAIIIFTNKNVTEKNILKYFVLFFNSFVNVNKDFKGLTNVHIFLFIC